MYIKQTFVGSRAGATPFCVYPKAGITASSFEFRYSVACSKSLADVSTLSWVPCSSSLRLEQLSGLEGTLSNFDDKSIYLIISDRCASRAFPTARLFDRGANFSKHALF